LLDRTLHQTKVTKRFWWNCDGNAIRKQVHSDPKIRLKRLREKICKGLFCPCGTRENIGLARKKPGNLHLVGTFCVPPIAGLSPFGYATSRQYSTVTFRHRWNLPQNLYHAYHSSRPRGACQRSLKLFPTAFHQIGICATVSSACVVLPSTQAGVHPLIKTFLRARASFTRCTGRSIMLSQSETMAK